MLLTMKKLGKNAIAEIVETIERCANSREISAEAERLSLHFGVVKKWIYELTKHVRPQRKARADKGNRLFDVEADANAKLLYGWIDLYGVSSAEAVLMAKNNDIPVPVGFQTIDRYLRQDGLGKKQRKTPMTPHRRFEASAPGEMFQFDMSGLKERWFDSKTRRIITVTNLEVSKNHPNTNPDRVRVWRFALVDDFSRREFIRYVAVHKPNSSHVVDFLLQAYSEMGVPHKLYTDNDKIIIGGRNKRATEILNKVLRDQGGYQIITHEPGRARATGKVERLHQSTEQEEKIIGIYMAERGPLDIETLNNRLAVGIMDRKNNKVHGTTGQTPMDRWHSKISIVRGLDYAQLRSAFMVDEWPVSLRGDLTFRLKGQIYQLPTGDQYPFGQWIGQKIHVVFPDGEKFFTVVDADLNEYDIPKKAAVADVAGEIKTTAESKSQRIRKEVRAVAKADAKRKREAGYGFTKLSHFDDDLTGAQASPLATDASRSNVSRFPKSETKIDPAQIQEVAPGRTAAAYSGAVLDYWSAYERFRGEFDTSSDCKAFLDSVYPSRDAGEKFMESEIRSALENYVGKPVRHLKAV